MKNDKYAAFTDAQLEQKLREASNPQERSAILTELTARFKEVYTKLSPHPVQDRGKPFLNVIVSQLRSETEDTQRSIMYTMVSAIASIVSIFIVRMSAIFSYIVKFAKTKNLFLS